MNYIDDTIKIDFPVNKPLQYAMQQCEIDDQEDNYGKYMNDVDFLVDNLAKAAYVGREISKAQWELIERRYQL